MRFFLRLALPTCLGAGAILCVLGACSDDDRTSFGPSYGDLPQRDGAADARADGDVVDISDGATTDGPKPGCTTGAVAVLSGDDGKLIASVDRGRGFAVALLTGGAAASFPALVGFGGGFLAVSRGANDALQWSQYTTAWSKPAPLSNLGSKGAPTLAAFASGVHVVYPAGTGTDRRFQHTIFDGTGWGADEPVQGPTTVSFGTDSAGLAVTAQDLAWAENGTNHGLYTRSRGGTWTDAVAVVGASSNGFDNNTTATPQIVSLEGTYDAVAFYVGKHDDVQKDHPGYLLRRAADRTWSFGGLLDTTLTTFQRLNVGRTRGGDLLVTMRASSPDVNGAGAGYYFRGTVSNDGIAWSAATPIGGATAIAADSPPSVTRGVCGDDAIIAFSSLGAVQITRLRGDAWTPSETIDGAAGYQVAVATLGD